MKEKRLKREAEPASKTEASDRVEMISADGGRYLILLKRCRETIIAGFLLLLIVGSSNVSATGVKGFLDIPQGVLAAAPIAGLGATKANGFFMNPWGSGIEQIGREMSQQGFSDRMVFFQGNGMRYYVTFAGYPGYAVFSLRADQLYEGWVSGLCQTTDPANNDAVKACFTRVREVLIEKYGPPTQEINHDGVVTHIYWDWGKTGGSGDEENITILLSQHFAKGGATEGSVDVSYLNRSLEGRLIQLDR